ncbi:MAG: DUF1080 domain-containing protein [Planctomycetia bacterium]|nr:DUF1080 domain-containing protein [Planctomycetia bacterium]
MKITKLGLSFVMMVIVSTSVCGNEWKPLFKEDLSDAKFTPGVWTKDAEGVVTASKDDSLWAVGNYENFELSLEFKTDNGTNSGVIVYCSDIPNWIPNSVEVQIYDDSPRRKRQGKADHTCCGAFYGHVAPTKLLVKEPGEWNTMHIRCFGPKIEVTLNGEKVSQMDMTQWTSARKNPDGTSIPGWLNKPKSTLPTKGSIGFQGKHGASNIYFRNIMIRNAQ